MSGDDPIDDVCESISDGDTVDWSVTDSGSAGEAPQPGVRGLRDLERIAAYNRGLQRAVPTATADAEAAPPEQWGHLTLLELASAGKSGEIWRAWDASLKREVALKFLLAPSEGDADESALLEEARALARLRHPGVVAVHGIGAHGGRVGMWMELLAGHSLEAEIERRGPLPLRDVARIGLELCRALEAIDAAGMVHGDIKPANIILESGGRTVLTDFGLGRRVSLAGRETWRISGTPLFMSPELLAGEPATTRSDLYALGVTLHWALTGQSPFRAQTLEELKSESRVGPSVSLRAARRDAPAALIDAVERAMAPQVEARRASAAQLAESFVQVLADLDAAAGRRARWRHIAMAAAALVLIGAAALFLSRVTRRAPSPQPARFSITSPPGATVIPDPGEIAVSPNGLLLAFAAADSAGIARLWLRPLGSLTARPLEGTENAVAPFWSPDSRNLGFYAEGKFRKISISGGSPEVLCEAPDPRGASWGKDGWIVFAPTPAGGLSKVSQEGGAVTEILRPDSARMETALRWPQFLPDGKHFFFVTLPPRDGGFDVFVGSVGSGGRHRVMSAGCAPICAGEKGIILSDNGRLMFQDFDYRRLRPVGAPIALGAAPSSDVSVGQPLAAASMTGVLAWPEEPLTNTRLVWLDRAGRPRGALPAPEGRYVGFSFAPDGRRLVAMRRSSPTEVDLWMIDLGRGEARRFSQGAQSRVGGIPVVSPDGGRIAFSSNRRGRTNIYQRLVNEAGDERLLYESSGQFKEVESWSPDGRYLVFTQADPATAWDIWLLPLDGKQVPVPYLKSRFNEYGPKVSPDGRWLTYTTDATGKPEVYARSFPKPGAEHLAASFPGFGFWSRGGTELLIIQSSDHSVWSVPVSTTPTFRVGTAHRLFRPPPEHVALASTPSGDRFLEAIPAGEVEPPSITVDLNVPELTAR